MKPYMPVVADILNTRQPAAILDAPCGSGWLASQLTFAHTLTGIDLFENKPAGYQHFMQADLDDGIAGGECYDAVVSCEGIEHIGNPLRFLTTAKQALNRNGIVIITTPNTWHPAAQLKYLLTGFFPGFPCYVGKIQRGTHMHIMPWSFPQLYLYFKLAGYTDIRLHPVAEKKPKHFYEKILGAPHRRYCRHRHNTATSAEEKTFWQTAGSDQSLFGRRLVVSATTTK